MSGLTKDIIPGRDKENDIRINRFLSDAGYCSRRQADTLIRDGRVLVDGVKAVVGQKVSGEELITVDGETVGIDNELVVIAYNKPMGVECTTDRSNPDNIVDRVAYPKRVYPVGRLDKNSSGLILLTNAGDIVNKILKGENGHEKEYIVKVNKEINRDFIEKMSGGIIIYIDNESRHVLTKKCEVKKLGKKSFSIILTQGFNRQIRRMCAELGYEVVSLERIRVMNIRLDGIKEDTWRKLTEEEITALLNELGE